MFPFYIEMPRRAQPPLAVHDNHWRLHRVPVPQRRLQRVDVPVVHGARAAGRVRQGGGGLIGRPKSGETGGRPVIASIRRTASRARAAASSRNCCKP